MADFVSVPQVQGYKPRHRVEGEMRSIHCTHPGSERDSINVFLKGLMRFFLRSPIISYHRQFVALRSSHHVHLCFHCPYDPRRSFHGTYKHSIHRGQLPSLASVRQKCNCLESRRSYTGQNRTRSHRLRHDHLWICHVP